MSTYILDDSLLGTDDIAIFQRVLRKVNLWDRLLVHDLFYRPLDVRAHRDSAVWGLGSSSMSMGVFAQRLGWMERLLECSEVNEVFECDGRGTRKSRSRFR